MPKSSKKSRNDGDSGEQAQSSSVRGYKVGDSWYPLGKGPAGSDAQAVQSPEAQRQQETKAVKKRKLAPTGDDGEQGQSTSSSSKKAKGSASVAPSEASKDVKSKLWASISKEPRCLKVILDSDQLETIFRSDWCEGKPGSCVLEVVARATPDLIVHISRQPLVVATTNVLRKPKLALEVSFSGTAADIWHAFSTISRVLSEEQSWPFVMRYRVNEVAACQAS